MFFWQDQFWHRSRPEDELRHATCLGRRPATPATGITSRLELGQGGQGSPVFGRPDPDLLVPWPHEMDGARHGTSLEKFPPWPHEMWHLSRCEDWMKKPLQNYLFLKTKIGRRKFRSQTSDNMDRWKAEQGRGREKRKIRKKKSRRERVRRKKMQMREKVGKSRNTVFFKWFVAPEGRKVGSLKRRVRSQLARWEMKNCTPLWREAHLQAKMYKTHQLRTYFY